MVMYYSVYGNHGDVYLWCSVSMYTNLCSDVLSPIMFTQ